MCKTILRNDYWCKGLGQTQPLSDAYIQFKEIKKKRALESGKVWIEKEEKNEINQISKQISLF
jgi:hypothetical protein